MTAWGFRKRGGIHSRSSSSSCSFVYTVHGAPPSNDWNNICRSDSIPLTRGRRRYTFFVRPRSLGNRRNGSVYLFFEGMRMERRVFVTDSRDASQEKGRRLEFVKLVVKSTNLGRVASDYSSIFAVTLSVRPCFPNDQTRHARVRQTA